MQASGSHLARVIDDDGKTRGILFLEDVLEILVGEVNDARSPGPRLAASSSGHRLRLVSFGRRQRRVRRPMSRQAT